MIRAWLTYLAEKLVEFVRFSLIRVVVAFGSDGCSLVRAGFISNEGLRRWEVVVVVGRVQVVAAVTLHDLRHFLLLLSELLGVHLLGTGHVALIGRGLRLVNDGSKLLLALIHEARCHFSYSQLFASSILYY